MDKTDKIAAVGCTGIVLPEEICSQIDQFLQFDEHPESQLIAVLHAVQMHFGYLPEAVLDEVAQRMQVPAATVSGVASFYHFFRLNPPGRHSISVCLGTACFVKGADKILEAFQSELGIGLGETTSDGEFSLDISRCLGICALAPVVQIDDQVYSQVKPNQVSQIISKFIEKEEE